MADPRYLLASAHDQFSHVPLSSRPRMPNRVKREEEEPRYGKSRRRRLSKISSQMSEVTLLRVVARMIPRSSFENKTLSLPLGGLRLIRFSERETCNCDSGEYKVLPGLDV